MRILIGFLFFIFSSVSLFSAPSLILQKEVNSYSLQPYLSFYEDDSESLTIEEIIKDDSMFVYHENRYPAFGYYDGAMWGKFTFEPGESFEKEWLLVFDSVRLELVSVYFVDSAGKYSVLHHDLNRPFYERLIKDKKIIFPFDFSGRVRRVYFRVESVEFMEIPALLITREGFARKNYKEALLVGLYYGIVVIMWIYNFSILLNVRDKSYFYYILYLGLFILAQSILDGLLFEFIVPDDYIFTRDLLIYVGALIVLLTFLFASSYFNFSVNYPRLHKLYLLAAPVALVPGIGQAFSGYSAGSRLLMFTIFWVSLLQLGVGFFLSFRSKMARYYFWGWLFFLTGVIIFSLRGIGVYFPYLSIYGMPWGNAAEVTTLSFGLAYRMRMLQNENQNLKYKTLHDRMFPHFLFNSLSSVVGIIESGSTKKAQDILMNLSGLYQFITYKSFQETVSLSKEIEFCKKYLEIMRVRFDDMIGYRFFIQGEIAEVEVSPFSIQPLLENIIKHGFDGERPVHIDVQVHVSEKKEVLITVENDGLPVQEEGAYSETLNNITGRLEIFYKHAGAEVKNLDGRGVVSTLWFSDKKEPDHRFIR